MTKVFVYGTLRLGFWNHHLLEDSNLIGKGKTALPYHMEVNVIPFVSEYREPKVPIVGEVYEIQGHELEQLDRLEGHPLWYRRREVEVILDTGEVVTAWLYFNETNDGEYIETGDYTDGRDPSTV